MSRAKLINLAKTTVRVLLLAIFFATPIQCGNKSKTANAKFETLPSKPIVITADTRINGRLVPGPWFSFRVKFNNGSDQAVTIMGVSLTVLGVGATGIQESKFSYAPSGFDYDYVFNTVTSYLCRYESFGVFAPLEISDLKLDNGNAYCKGYPIFTPNSLAIGPSGRESYAYSVRMKVVGWFGPYDAPSDRFEKIVNFYTQ